MDREDGLPAELTILSNLLPCFRMEKEKTELLLKQSTNDLLEAKHHLHSLRRELQPRELL